MTDAAAINILSLSAGAQNQLLQQYFSSEGTLCGQSYNKKHHQGNNVKKS